MSPDELLRVLDDYIAPSFKLMRRASTSLVM